LATGYVGSPGGEAGLDATMKKYSIFTLARNALNYHKDWERAWRSPTPRKNMM
jgi:hypothetical protein